MTELDPPARIRGCLLGGAVGDALGADVEFDSIGEIRLRRGPGGVTGYPDPERRGRVTDDTQMSLFTAEGLIRADNRFADRGICNVPAVIHRAYLRWLLTQVGDESRVPWDEFGSDEPSGWLLQQRELWVRRAPGLTCLSALQSGTAGTPERTINDSKGCGGVMRVAPIGLVAAEPFALAVSAAAITHTHPTGYLAAGAFAEIISHVTSGTELVDAAKLACERTAGEVGGDETAAALEAALELADGEPVATPEAVESLGGGWVAEEALAIALYCSLTADDFSDGVRAAVNHSGDSDSTGSMCGNLLGAVHGVDSVPVEFRDRLAEGRVVDQLASDLVCHFVEGRSLHDLDRYPTW
jgi:ADP-ribosyl-[dinitrogen reductase] hydrolase